MPQAAKERKIEKVGVGMTYPNSYQQKKTKSLKKNLIKSIMSIFANKAPPLPSLPRLSKTFNYINFIEIKNNLKKRSRVSPV